MAATPITDFKDFRLLVEVQGPFVSTAVLRDTFPQGFPKEETHSDDLRRLRQSYEAWRDAAAFDTAAHYAWLQFVLRDVLEFDETVLATGQAIAQSLRVHIAEARLDVTPDLLVTTHPEEDLVGEIAPAKPLVPVFFYPRGHKVDKPLDSARLTPIDRAVAFLRGSGFAIALLTNGEQWTAVYTPANGVTSTATWYAEMWLEEPVTVRAFRALLGARRWFHAAAESTLPKLLERSALNQGAVTAQLGRQVRQAVELLILALDRADQDKHRGLLAGIPETELYQAALTVMMRLVFLFFAEERELLPATDPLYAAAYAVSTIREQLQTEADRFGAEVLERRHDAWSRLLATFRAVHAGLGHDRLTLPAYGGQLFDPERYCFLEGRQAGTSWRDTPAAPLPVDNRTILYALEALQILREKGAEPRQLTFRELDVPDIGHVYESLLDHTARRAESVTLSLVSREGEEPEVALAQLEEWRAAGEDRLVRELADLTGKSANAIRNLLSEDVDGRLRDRLRTACRGDQPELDRVLPFANLVRDDPWGNPVVILPGSVYVTAGADRRSTGTHYTPTTLTEPIVQYTLEPVVYEGPAEGKPRDEWKLKSAADLLKLKICDMACGSGAFLVAACRYLAARVQEAWAAAGAFAPGAPRRSPEGWDSTGAPEEDLIPLEPEAREAYALRVVAQRCLYGVDKNPLAAEMAKLSLWLLTLAKGKPFTFLDHAIKSGDSLIGVSREQLESFDLDDTGQRVFGLGPALDYISDTRRTLAMVRAETVADVARQSNLLANAERKTEALRWLGDALLGMEFRGVDEGERVPVGAELAMLLAHDNLAEMREITSRYSNGVKPFHWELEFPEVFEGRGGFDAIVGNPPFIGGQKITGVLGRPYREYLVNRIAGGQRGSADYSAYFFLRARTLLQSGSCFGLLATNTIAQGDTREVGLDQLSTDCSIMRAIPSRPWPGEATLEIADVWVQKGPWPGPFVLDDYEVPGITPFLTPAVGAKGKPYRLRANEKGCFKGSEVGGMEAFVFSPDVAASLIETDPCNERVVKPFLDGDDLNSNVGGKAGRWSIFFGNSTLEEANEYPVCLEYVRKHVDSETRGKWWCFRRPTTELYERLAGFERVLVIAETSRTLSPMFVPNGQVFSKALIVFTNPGSYLLAVIQSSIHVEWVLEYGLTLRTDARYVISDCFETFPFPSKLTALETIGERYHSTRARMILARQLGLTKLYNLFHDSSCQAPDIQELRDLHVEMDRVVAAAYGWKLDLGHGFHQTKQGVRFTISPAARATVLDLLLTLNHERYAAEQQQQPAKKRAGTRRAPRRPSTQPLLEVTES